MDWNDLRYLLAMHRHGSLARAAKGLGVTKATMSRRLAALEEALGTRLFDRKPGGATLTAAGREVVATAEDIDQSARALEGRLAAATDAKPSGTVRVTAPQWLAARFVIPFLPDLKKRYPTLDVQLVGTNQILNLAQHEADLALRNVWPSQASLTARKVVELGGCVYASSLYLERKGTPNARDALAGHDLLVYEGLGGMPGFEWMREPGHGTIAFRANDPEALVSAATAGLGLAAVPCLLGDAQPSLVRVKALGFGRCDLFLVAHEQLRRTPRVRVVSDFIAELLVRHRA
ncbi:MAG TPA: LysR family transcriptional regulator, partial [Polyangiaceae bacterium]|nr:LysR family transcriptional regulator [Polyangiaceae bacterium]